MDAFLSGALAGVAAKTSIAPFCRMRILFQASPDKKFSLISAADYMKQSYQVRGFRSFFRGNSLTMIRSVAFSGLQWSSFEHFKRAMNVDEKNNRTPFRLFACSVLGGATATIPTYPLDVMNARMAANPECKRVRNVFSICCKNAPRSFYQGITPTLMGTIPYSGTLFFMHSSLKIKYEQKNNVKTGPILSFLFGALSSILAQSMAYPLDTTRRRMQTSNGSAGMLETIRKIGKEGIVRGFYKGMTVNWINVPISAGIYLSSYEQIKYYVDKACSSRK